MIAIRRGWSASVPKPRINFIHFHGAFVTDSKYRALVTAAKRGKGNKAQATGKAKNQTPCRAWDINHLGKATPAGGPDRT